MTISVTKAQVPTFLIGSEFYDSLNSDDAEQFHIPAEFMKETPSVASADDFAHLLHTMRFWGVRTLPREVIGYCVRHPMVTGGEFDKICGILKDLDSNFGLLEIYRQLQSVYTRKQMMSVSSKHGRSDFVEYLITDGKKVGSAMVKTAAEFGLLDLLQRLTRTIQDRNQDPFVQVIARRVAAYGHADCLKFLLRKGCKGGPSVCAAAAENGHLDCLKIAHEQGCAWIGSAVQKAAKNGHLACLTYACEHGCAVPDDCTRFAAENGQLACLRYLHERDYPWDLTCAYNAAARGHLECVRYLIDHECPIDHTVTNGAAIMGQLPCLTALLEADFPASCGGVDGAARRGLVDVLRELNVFAIHLCDVHIHEAIARDDVKYLRSIVAAGYQLIEDAVDVALTHGSAASLDFICSQRISALSASDTQSAAEAGELECLQVLHKHHCPWDIDTCTSAAEEGHLDCLQFAREHGCPWETVEILSAAAGFGHLDVLVYAVDQGCVPDASVCEEAARYDHDDCLQFLHERANCPWDERTCTAAALGLSLACLEYAHNHGCPWDVETTIAAAKVGSLRCLQYAVENGCPCYERTVMAAASAPATACLQYLHERGCPWTVAVSKAAEASPACLRYCVEHHCPITKRTLDIYHKQKKDKKLLPPLVMGFCICGLCHEV